MMKNLLVCILLLIVLLVGASGVVFADEREFSCGGKVETEVWSLWDTRVKQYLTEKQVQVRLFAHGDVYALYDLQTYSHNLVAMARRCQRTDRLREIAQVLQRTYGALEPAPGGFSGRRWVCRGGSICTDKNRLLQNEVMLDSVQFLGLATSVAHALALSGTLLSDADREFIQQTVQITAEHLLRWSTKSSLVTIEKAFNSTPADVKNGSSALFFTDKPLWLLHCYAELAGVLAQPGGAKLLTITDLERRQLQTHLSKLLVFFTSRLTFTTDRHGVLLADIDRGYWRLYADNRYASYNQPTKPVVCEYSGNDKKQFSIRVMVTPDSVPLQDDVGWDISHARRLVHTLDALQRNRNALQRVFDLPEVVLPRPDTAQAFANSLVSVAWNGDDDKPLFKNYLCGANGWYRVAYDNGTGQCREGYPPFGLTDSFLTGGYATWARHNRQIGVLAQRLYRLSCSTKPNDRSFMATYYPQLSPKAASLNRTLAKIMFLPSLVGVSPQ